MACLPPGAQYGLSSEAPNHKDLVFVKLTDSALRSIVEYVRNMGKLGSTPTIQFLANDLGKISIPNGGTQPVTFRFNLASNAEMEGPQGSFECLQAAGSRQLRTLGALPTRMRVLANEDVYENTKKRMASETENQKKNCTRVIKPNQTDIGRKVKVKQQRPLQPPSSRNMPPSSSLNNSLSSSSSLHPNRNAPDLGNGGGNINSNSSSINNVNMNGLHATSNGTMYSHTNGNGVHIGNSNSQGYSSVNSYTGVYSGGGGGGFHSANHNNNVKSSNVSNFNSNVNNLSNHNVNNGGGQYGAQQHPPSAAQPRPQGGQLNPATRQTPPNPDLLRRPIKERLIQLLALKPYKKPELYMRINQEGVKDKEKGVIKTILMQISSLKDNCFQLHRHLWNDVNEDWPFYSEDEKQILKRRKPQNLTPPLSSDSGHSPSPPPQGHKRAPPSSGNTLSPSTTPNNGLTGQPPSKKQRISHYKKPTQHDSISRDGSDSPAALSNGYHSSTSMSSGERKSYSDEDIPTPIIQLPCKRDNSYLLSLGTTAKNFLSTPPKQNGYDGAILANDISPDKDDISPASSSTRDKSPDSTTNQQEVPEYANEYTEIRTVEQRRMYKADFSAQYLEYKQLHTKVERVTQLFTRLEERLREEPPGGHNHKEIQRQIVEEYQRINRDAGYQRDVAHFKQLHLKLAHIKGLVLQYDKLHHGAATVH